MVANNERSDLNDYMNEQIQQYKRVALQLETENSKLKEDLLINTLRHHDEVKYITNKHALAVEESAHAKSIEIQELETRHAQAIAALKRIHLDEITSIKEVLFN